MKLKRQPEPELPLEHVERERADALFCEWTSYTHNRCHMLADPGLPFCAYHCAAVVGIARGSSAPDDKTRAMFELVWEHYADAEDDQEVNL